MAAEAGIPTVMEMPAGRYTGVLVGIVNGRGDVSVTKVAVELVR